MHPVTLKDVATRAGVSQPTASRVLNGSARRPAEDVVAAVQAAAAELGYVPNAQAQALARSQTGILGLVVHDIADPYFAAIAAGVQHVAAEQDRMTMLASTLRDPARELDAVQTFVAHRADALLLAGSRRRDDPAHEAALQTVLQRYRETGGQIATIGQPIAGTHGVIPENRSGARALAGALLAAGHTRYVILSGPPGLATAADRTAGFQEGLAAGGAAAPEIVPGEFTRDGGYDAALRAHTQLDLRAETTCLFAANDVMAIGAMAALREAGLTVPDDVGVAGFDDIQTLRDHHPGLTTVRLPLSQMGDRAAHLVLSPRAEPTGAATEPGEPIVEHLGGQVLLRESTSMF